MKGPSCAPASQKHAAYWPDGRARRSLLTRRSPPSDEGGSRPVRRSSTSDLSRRSSKSEGGRREAGANHFCYSEAMSSPKIKNISVYSRMKIRCISSPIPSYSEGRRPSSRTLGGLRWTLVYAETMAWIKRTAKPCGPAPVAGVKPSAKRELNRRRRSQPRTRLRGDHGISRKAIAQGRPGVLLLPCMLVCSFFSANRTPDRGCSAHPVFPAPSYFGGKKEFLAKLGRNASREREVTF